MLNLVNIKNGLRKIIIKDRLEDKIKDKFKQIFPQSKFRTQPQSQH